MLFNVCFTTQWSRLQALFDAVDQTQSQLRESAENAWMRSMLLPAKEDGCFQKRLNTFASTTNFHDSALNYEQSKAIDTVIHEEYGPVPFVISGPPGTGKTKTLVELVLQLLATQPAPHLLVCAPSDSAADTLNQRLSAHLRPRHLLRVNASTKSFPEVPNTVLPFCCVDDGMFSIPSLAELMRCKVIVTTCRDAQMLIQTRVTNRDLSYLERNLRSAIHPELKEELPSLHWTGLLLDEAAQATEPEALLPMNVVAPPADTAEKSWPLFVMAGDQHQLSPRTASKTLAVQTSLFARLLDRPSTVTTLSHGRGNMLPILRPAFIDLIRNYRSHPVILAMPSALFYYDTLEPEATDTDALLSWIGWKRHGWPILFRPNTGLDEIERDGGGWYNILEARTACSYAESFIRTGLLRPNEVCIMSPFQAQVRVLRNDARQLKLHGVNIGPLEAFQGLESRLAILCTTRTRDRFIEQDVAKGLDVMYEPKRFNVALTRAKQGLIVVGNPEVLKKDENWKTFLAFCQRNGLHEDLAEGVVLVEDAELGLRSRLEKQLLRQEEALKGHAEPVNGLRKLGFSGNEQDKLWEDGLRAEAAGLDEDEYAEYD